MADEPAADWRQDFEVMKQTLKIHTLFVVGGEPLLFKELKELIDAALEVAEVVQLNTNGLLLSKNKWLLDYLKTDKFKIYVSYHQREELFGKSKYDEILFDSLGKFLNRDPAALLKRVSTLKHLDQGEGIFMHPNVNLGVTYTKWRYPELDEQDLPKPYNSNYVKARTEMCQCPVPHYSNGKIHKCHLTVLLPKVLEKYGKYDDSWQQLKNYVPYDLLTKQGNFGAIELPEPVCSICPENTGQCSLDKYDKYSKIMNQVTIK